MTFYTAAEAIPPTDRITYVAVCVPPAEVEAQLLRHPLVAAAFAETRAAAHQSTGADLALKNEYHCTLQFFSPPKGLADEEAAGLVSLLGVPVQMTVQYVAFTPKLAAIRLSIVHPLAVSMSCANSCPHLTLAVGTGSQAVWSNELLCVLEDKQVPPNAAPRVGWWKSARVIPLCSSADGSSSTSASSSSLFMPPASPGESLMKPITLTGKVSAFVAASRGGGGGPRYSPTSMSPTTSPGRGGAMTLSPTTFTNSPSSRGGGCGAGGPPPGGAGPKDSADGGAWPVTYKSSSKRKVSPQGRGGAMMMQQQQQQQQQVHQDAASAAPARNPAVSHNALLESDNGPSISPMRRAETLEP